MTEARARDLRLVRPSVEHRETFLRGLDELRRDGLPWYLGPDYEGAYRDFDAFVVERLADATRAEKARTQLWAIADGSFVGRIGIHHCLDDALRVEGGHVGYDTVPSFRRRGVATAMLRGALPFARALGLDEILLTCDDDNAASIRVIEANGGVLRERKTLRPGRPPKRYYRIDLRPAVADR